MMTQLVGLLGRIVGYLVTFGATVWRRLSQALQQYLRYALTIALIAVAVPPVAQYWLRHIPLPQVPISAIVAMVATSLMLLSFTVLLYVATYLLRQIAVTERAVFPAQEARRRNMMQPYSEGAFIPHSDEKAWAEEGFELLKKQGILTETDTTQIMELAQEMGLEALQKEREKQKV